VRVLFSPGRYAYVTSAREQGAGCILCTIRDAKEDEPNLVLHRSPLCFVVINKYPYNSGHLMIVPNRHEGELHALSCEERCDIIELAGRAEKLLRGAYRPQGINLGMNLGESAGAGIVGHVHLHLVPRWSGDTNFMSVVGATRVIPEDPSTTYERLKPLFEAGPEGGER